MLLLSPRRAAKSCEAAAAAAAASAPTPTPASKPAPSAAPAPPAAGQTIFVSGIPYEATEDDLRKVFAGIGKITYVSLSCFSFVHTHPACPSPTFAGLVHWL